MYGFSNSQQLNSYKLTAGASGPKPLSLVPRLALRANPVYPVHPCKFGLAVGFGVRVEFVIRHTTQADKSQNSQFAAAVIDIFMDVPCFSPPVYVLPMCLEKSVTYVH